jgi:hypothetical protein
MNNDVLHPYALLDGSMVDIHKAAKGKEYTCLNPYCGGRMVPRQGDVNQWHFAHVNSGESQSCSSESWLHSTTKALVAQSFQSAKAAGVPYIARGNCPKCPGRIEIDLADSFDVVFTESNVIGLRRPDLLFSTTRNYDRLIIEVVVTHAPERGTLETYKDIEFTTGILRPTHSDIDHAWVSGIHLSSILDYPKHQCIEWKRPAPPRNNNRPLLPISEEEFERRLQPCRFVDDNKGKAEGEFFWCTTHSSRTTQAARCSRRIMPYERIEWAFRVLPDYGDKAMWQVGDKAPL